MAKAVRTRTDSCANALNLLHEHLDGDIAAQSLVVDVFQQLHLLEQDAKSVVDESPESTPSPHALLIDGNANERQLLASYLRQNGFEVTATAGQDDALDYLSLHSCPDVVLLDLPGNHAASADLLTQIRDRTRCDKMKLFAFSDAQPVGVDCWFRRPLDAERLVRELSAAIAA